MTHMHFLFFKVKEAAESEWDTFKTERSAGLEEILQFRQRAAEEEARKRTEREAAKAADAETKPPVEPEPVTEKNVKDEDMGVAEEKPKVEDTGMDIDDDARKEDVKTEAIVRADDDEAVEY